MQSPGGAGRRLGFGMPPLVEEALEQAVERDVNGVSTRVFTAEHLAAICLQVGWRKDFDRIIRFVEARVLDAEDGLTATSSRKLRCLTLGL